MHMEFPNCRPTESVPDNRAHAALRTIIPISGREYYIDHLRDTQFNNAVIDFFAIRPSDRVEFARSPTRQISRMNRRR